MIQVRYFAHLKEVTGAGMEKLDMAGQTVSHLKQVLTEKYNLSELASAMTAVNEEFVNDDTVLADGDQVAFIPPVSGG